VGRDLSIPSLPKGGNLSEVVLLIIGIVGTTVAPWQLFFQQSYIIDKRITPRFMTYEKIDLWIGIFIVIVGATAIIAFTAATFAGHQEFGQFTDARGVAEGLRKYVGRAAGILFAVALIDSSIIGAAAVGLSTSYALADVLGLKHSLHRTVSDAKLFYLVFAGILLISAIVVLIPDSPLGLLTVGVQVLAGVLLPSATVFLLLLCNDKEVLGPWVNSGATNVFTSVVIAALVVLSLVLTAAVLFPDISSTAIIGILIGGSLLFAAAGVAFMVFRHFHGVNDEKAKIDQSRRSSWRMPPLALLAAPKLSAGSRIGLTVLRSYLLIAMILVIFRVYQLATGH
jgi:Mn2+/Fe2+ NRAMP family transporter